jgi:2-methylcitrate dehydratase PrpD
MKMDVIYTLAGNIIDTNYENLPSEVVKATKRLFMDGLGVGLAGSAEAGVSELIDIVRDWDGRKESTVWVYGDRLPCVSAAQANATMIHALDYDDTHDVAILHASSVAVPTALAIAEKLGGVDGKRLITAVALAVDLAARLCLANKVSVFDRGWQYTAIHGNFSAAAITGKLLGLDKETLVSAFGLAYHQAGGNLQCIHDGTLAKRAGPGFAARDGIMAVLMAQKGITGARNVLQGRDGLFNVYHRGDYNPEVLTANLGEKFEVVNLSFKPYPCCRNTNPPIDATLTMVGEYNIKAEDVDSVTIYVSKGAMKLLGESLNTKQNPSTTVDAQFSIPWTVASAIVQGKVGIAEFTPQAIKNKAVLALSNKVTPKLDESLNRMGVSPAIVEIKTKDGKVYSKRVDTSYGSPENPMNMDAIAAKLRDCASYAAKPLSQKNVEKLIQLVSQLEAVSDVEEVVRLLV